MKIAIIDADLINKTKHRFPNLACMKISGYHKDLGDNVVLKLNYDNMENYDLVYISKVFTDTKVDELILEKPNVKYGGTGFFYDKAQPLPYNIEHHMPDYHLYDSFVESRLKGGEKPLSLRYYTDYSIGFLTRGCFRHCQFCVNQNYNHVVAHSPLKEFLDPSRRKICVLDDNFLGYSGWENLLEELQNSGKKFQFKQGLDERILTESKCEMLFKSKYDGDFIFAFDDVNDREIIEEKAKLIRHYCKYKKHNVKFYVLCAFDRNRKYDRSFWIQDIKDTFKRIFTLTKYGFQPYVMRFEKYRESPFYGTYVNLARWCNQPGWFNSMSYKVFCVNDDLKQSHGRKTSSTYRYYQELINENDNDILQYIDIVPKTTRVDYSEW